MPFDTRPKTPHHAVNGTAVHGQHPWPVGLPECSPAQIEAFGQEMDALREAVIAETPFVTAPEPVLDTSDGEVFVEISEEEDGEEQEGVSGGDCAI